MKHKSLVIWMIVVALLLTITLKENAYAATNKGYLLLIENKDGTWNGYEGRDIISKVGTSICVLPSKVSGYLGLEYERGEDCSTITNGTKSSTFTDESKNYTYNTKTTKKKRTLPVIFKGKLHYSGFKSLVKGYRYYKASEAKEYKDMGYSGVLCMSQYQTVENLPAVTKMEIITPEITSDFRVVGNFLTPKEEMVVLDPQSVYEVNRSALNDQLLSAFDSYFQPDLYENTYTRLHFKLLHDSETNIYGIRIGEWRRSYDHSSILANRLNAVLETFYFLCGDEEVSLALWHMIDDGNLNGFSNSADYGFKDVSEFENGFIISMNDIEVKIIYEGAGSNFFFQ